MTTTDQQVRKTLDEYFRAAERRDADRCLAFFSPGDDLTAFEDDEMYDWDGLVAYIRGFFEQVAEIRLQLERCTVDPLAPNVAVATGVFSAAGTTASGDELSIRNCFTFVFVNQEDRWLIKHVHESSL